MVSHDLLTMQKEILPWQRYTISFFGVVCSQETRPISSPRDTPLFTSEAMK